METKSANLNLIVHIDNRLVHGQIAVNWKQALQFDTVVVVDDALVNDKLTQTLMKMTIEAAGLKGYFATVANAPRLIQTLAVSRPSLFPGRRRISQLFIICRTPRSARQLIEGGISVEEVSIWNMFKREGKHKIVGTVYMDDTDFDDIAVIKLKGTKVAIQESAFSAKRYL
ncbi:PTS sugar transporter subunit IIB [Sporolactobacillus vineae]|uniref:PTS sugar transporter subunit IIB n=1 Tax=Sporolactobacillus vineae TaxID=444463 RepID=UPI0002FBD8ED|nr:PTS sugar transporter subunit IIB [Sporolactobacillus vineae]